MFCHCRVPHMFCHCRVPHMFCHCRVPHVFCHCRVPHMLCHCRVPHMFCHCRVPHMFCHCREPHMFCHCRVPHMFCHCRVPRLLGYAHVKHSVRLIEGGQLEIQVKYSAGNSGEAQRLWKVAHWKSRPEHKNICVFLLGFCTIPKMKCGCSLLQRVPNHFLYWRCIFHWVA